MKSRHDQLHVVYFGLCVAERRAGVLPVEGPAGGERGLCADPSRGMAQAAGLVRDGGRSARPRAQGKRASP